MDGGKIGVGEVRDRLGVGRLKRALTAQCRTETQFQKELFGPGK